MLTPKQRAELKSVANSLDPAFQVGKEGVGDAQAAQIADYLRVHEIVKVKVLDNALLTAREAAEDIAQRTDSEVVFTIGSKAVLFKRNPSEPVLTLSTIEGNPKPKKKKKPAVKPGYKKFSQPEKFKFNRNGKAVRFGKNKNKKG